MPFVKMGKLLALIGSTEKSKQKHNHASCEAFFPSDASSEGFVRTDRLLSCHWAAGLLAWRLLANPTYVGMFDPPSKAF